MLVSGEAAVTATLALGLPGFVVLGAAEYGGAVELLIETTESVTGCPACGVVATLHDRRKAALGAGSVRGYLESPFETCF
jgi:hypothetical protein